MFHSGYEDFLIYGPDPYDVSSILPGKDIYAAAADGDFTIRITSGTEDSFDGTVSGVSITEYLNTLHN